jgi:hypothetical protein
MPNSDKRAGERLQILLLIITLSLPSAGFAGTYWVRPTGTQTNWASCKSETQPADNNANYCTLATANTNAVAGDTVNLMAGTYTDGQIKPANSGTGTGTGRIIFQAYPAPGTTSVVITGSPPDLYGINISNKDYIKVDGITIRDTTRWMQIVNHSDYNEITNCTFYSSSIPGPVVTIMISSYCDGGVADYTCPSTHNWFHGNTVHTAGSAACGEGVGLLAIGSANTNDYTTTNNTIEDNVFYHGGHHTIEVNTKNNVIRNNIFQNEGFKTNPGGCAKQPDPADNYPGDNKYGHRNLSLYAPHDYTAVSVDRGSTTTITDNDVDFTQACGGGSCLGWIAYNQTKSQTAVVTSISDVGNHTINFSTMPATNDTGNLYFVYEPMRNLLEGNRIGHASVNPANDGAENIGLYASGYIVRYNAIFGADGSGIYAHYHSWGRGAGPTGVPIYNNTIYKNGRYSGTSTIQKYGFRFVGAVMQNKVKNNIIYDTGTDFNSTTDQIVSNNWLTRNGDPLFLDNTLTISVPPSSTVPNLSLQSSSPAINGGTYLTQANGSGSSSTMLVVNDALYFQDGTWGSDLTRAAGRMQADWIAIGWVGNIVQIKSINYSTNTITLRSPMTWSDRANIWLYKKSDGLQVIYGSAPDYGAYEFFPEAGQTLAPPKNLRPQ